MRQVGTTTLHLPPMGLGVAHLGGMYGTVPGDQARATLQAAWDGGYRFFDTAPWYGRGKSEHRLGAFLMDHVRDDVIITTKVGRVLHRPADPATFDRLPWPGGLGFEVEFSYTYDAVMRAYEQSLMRLATDRIDALLIHDPDPIAHGDQFEVRMAELEQGGIRALEELKASGQIKAIGMGLNTIEALEHCANRVPLDFLIIAMPYTLLDQSALEAMDDLARRGISVIIGAPYASGILVTGPVPGARYRYQPATHEIMAKAAAIQAVCAAHRVSLASAALHFALAHPAVVSAIPGAARPEEATATLAAFAAHPPAAFWADLRAQGLIDPAAPVPARAVR
jgi:D-threo-aldose 1-dehydrogenase